MLCRRYSRLLAHYPFVVLGLVTLLSMISLVVILTVAPAPDFSDPAVGFETRGTDLSNRIRSLDLLLDSTSTDYRNKAKQHPLPSSVQRQRQINNTEDEQLNGSAEHDREENFFCDIPRRNYARVVYATRGDHSTSLFNASLIRSMCAIEDTLIRSNLHFSKLCIRQTLSRSCCKSWNLGNYIALIVSKTNCESINDTDVNTVQDILESCVQYYQDGSLTPDCWTSEDNTDTGICKVPRKCKIHNAVYNFIHYLTDAKFSLTEGENSTFYLTYTMSFLPIASSTASAELYKSMDAQSFHNDYVSVVAIDFGLKQQLFDYYVKKDMLWIFVSMIVVWIAMWIYTASLFLTLMTLLSIAMSLTLSFFFYTIIFKIKFFPFMNLLAVVILLGVGCDDVFIYSRVWYMAKLEKNVGMLEKVISDTIKHAALSMLVTSLTTACAFFANFVSDITALKCFGIYTGTAILINFLMMVTWTPAAIIVQDKWCTNCCVCFSLESISQKKYISCFCKLPSRLYNILCEWSRIFFDKVIVCLILKLRILWILLFGICGILSIIVVVYLPGLKLPTSREFQVFANDHPFEIYDLKMKDQFRFEKSSGVVQGTMPLTFVWGFKAVDNGNHMDPYSKGQLEYDESFNVSTPKAQQWLINFCAVLRSFEKYQPESGLQLSNCFIESFKLFMQRECLDIDGQSLEPCCKSSVFPYKVEVFNQCLRIWIPMLTSTRLIYPTNRFAGPRYNTRTGKLDAVIVEFNSKVPFTYDYQTMDSFFKSTEELLRSQMVSAPPEMASGWFVSHLDFYDLQHSISTGTLTAIIVALVIASIVAFLTTLNILVSLYAMLSISLSIFTTIAALVLLGWQLNILESVTISIAVGLSIDFALHYGMAYRLSPDMDKSMRVICATSRMGAPTAMAALTTFLAGAMMLPSTILAYQQLGTFLMLVVLISWLYSTFFFLSLLKTIGPEGGFGQFHWPSCYCFWGGSKPHVDKTVYTMSESNLSNSIQNNSSDTHELEPLTERPDITYTPNSRNSSKHASNISLTTSLGCSNDTLRLGSTSSHTSDRVDFIEPQYDKDNHCKIKPLDDEEELDELQEDTQLLNNTTNDCNGLEFKNDMSLTSPIMVINQAKMWPKRPIDINL